MKKLIETANQGKSIAHIAQATLTAQAAYDKALTAIEEAQRLKSTPDDPKPPVPPVKKRRVVDAKTLLSKSFIETPEDMETFLTKLRAELEAALEANERIQIK